MTTRRELLLALGASALAALPALAQQEKRLRRIGYFALGNAQVDASWLAAFREGMLALRWVEGSDYVIDARHANGVAQAGPGVAAALVVSQPDLLLTTADTTSGLLTRRTKTIPIVFAMAQDPVGNGIVASLQRPGGNATGLSSLASELAAKRLQLLKEAFPRVAHVVLLFEPDNVGSVSQAKEIEEVAPRLGMRITLIGLRQPAGQIFPSASRIRCGVAGCAVTRALNGRSASLIAFITAAGEPAVPASPAPFAPSPEVAVGVHVCAISMSGISRAIGTR
jgi:putative ABC transport system substrate-binding protein